MRDLMIDIETLGNRPGSVILSVGAITFDAETGEMGEEFYAAIDPESASAVGLTTDVSTMVWWMKQSDAARQAAFSGDRQIRVVLADFGEFFRRIDATRVWAKPPSFDLVLIEAAFRACGVQIPWHFRTHRDCRTIFDITGTKQPEIGTVHNALDDAKAQALGIIDAYRKLAVSSQKAAPEVGLRWLPIAQADKTITDVKQFPIAEMVIKMSDRYWVRDEDGRVYEAAWSEGNHGRDFWWDFEGESPVDPIEFAPHPFDPRWAAASEGTDNG